MSRRSLVACCVAAAALGTASAALAATEPQSGEKRLRKVDHIVVIYQENHSFDNLYGLWEGAVEGIDDADPAHTLQVNQQGVVFQCLLQNDVNLTSPPLTPTCTDSTTPTTFQSHFPNAPFAVDDYIPPSATTCPAPGVSAPNGVPNGQGLPGGCTRDLVHRFYQEIYQLDGGRQDRYVTGSDAVGLAMGYYDTTELPIYEYLHQEGHPKYAIADRFFQAAFGGSFLNHQWLIAASNPVWPGAVNDGGADDLHSVVDQNGMPNNYPLYQSPLGTAVRDAALTASCTPPATRPPTPPGVLCGDYAINTIQPFYQPYAPGTAETRRLPPQTAPTIGDRLTEKGVRWAWYSGGWSNANGDVGAPGWTNGAGPVCTDPNANASSVFPNCPDKLFQFHHQPFNYYASFAPGTAQRRRHLRDEAEFFQLANASTESCELRRVSFIKPVGAENEHPGYASETAGSTHLVDLIRAVEDSKCAASTMIVVTYDEFGGQWDHVPPPGQGGTTPGPSDVFGPGTRIPALVISPQLRDRFVVDHTSYDTTSIVATIERRFRLAPLATRDAAVEDLTNVFRATASGTPAAPTDG